MKDRVNCVDSKLVEVFFERVADYFKNETRLTRQLKASPPSRMASARYWAPKKTVIRFRKDTSLSMQSLIRRLRDDALSGFSAIRTGQTGRSAGKLSNH